MSEKISFWRKSSHLSCYYFLPLLAYGLVVDTLGFVSLAEAFGFFIGIYFWAYTLAVLVVGVTLLFKRVTKD